MSNLPPGPKRWPLIGNLFNVDVKKLPHSVFDHRELYGDISLIEINGTKIVFLNSVSAIDDVFLNPTVSKYVRDRGSNVIVDFVLKNSLSMSSYSEEWEAMQSVTMSCVSKLKDNKMIRDNVYKEIVIVNDYLETLFDKEFDPEDIIYKLAYNLSFIIFLGKRYNHNDKVFEIIARYSASAVPLTLPSANTTERLFPFAKNLPFGYGKHFQENAKCKQMLKKYVLEETDNSKIDKNGIIHALMQNEQSKCFITDENLETNIASISSVSSLPTKYTLLFSIYFLVSDQVRQQKVHKEIEKVVGSKLPAIGDQAKMPYTSACILETLRISSVADMAIPYETSETFTVRDFDIPKGSIVIKNLWKIHHDEAIWGDPWTFRPERFLDNAGNLLAADHVIMKNFYAFGNGGRPCMGIESIRPFLFLVLTGILQEFKLTSKTLDTTTIVDPKEYKKQVTISCPKFTMSAEKKNQSVGF